jgi:transposase
MKKTHSIRTNSARIADLPNDVKALKQLLFKAEEGVRAANEKLAERDTTVTKQKTHIRYLEEIVKLFKANKFGKSSEKSPAQTELFDEAEVEGCDNDQNLFAEAVEPETAQVPSASTAKAGRKPIPKYFPRIIVEHDLTDEEKRCSCGCEKQHIGDEVSEQLDIVPAVIQVLQHRRKKYACKSCEGQLQTAILPPQPIPKSNASPSLLAYIATAKYQDGLPLYRIENILSRLNIHLPRNTQANWMIKGSELLQPLYNLLNDLLLESGYVHMDETPVQVLKEPGKKAESKSYMWVRKTGDPNKKESIVLFDYASSRKADVVKTLLPDFQGYLQTDDYAGYNHLDDIKGVHHIGCFAHARRKFIEAQKVAPSKKGATSKADMAVSLIKNLYAIEKKIKDLSPDKRLAIRQSEAIPQLEKLKSWLDKSLVTTLPKVKTGMTLSYLAKNWKKLTVYVENERLNIDNNAVENTIRPFAIGRKNWMFSNSQEGAKASAMLYSIIETAKSNDLNPHTYLQLLFTKMPLVKSIEEYEQLLPWNAKELLAKEV